MDRQTLRLRAAAADDTPALLKVWRRAVESTHHFLAPSDVDEIEVQVRAQALPGLDVTVAVRGDAIVGWAGIHRNHVEALFVDPDAHRQGVGTALLDAVTAPMVVATLDVNEQNPDARAFYEARGFVRTGRSERDDDGRPFPIIHLRRG